jgi:hypothetical protein
MAIYMSLKKEVYNIPKHLIAIYQQDYQQKPNSHNKTSKKVKIPNKYLRVIKKRSNIDR